MKVDRREALKMVSTGVGVSVAANALPAHHNVVIRTAPGTVATRFPASGQFNIAMKPSFRITRNGASEVVVCHADLIIKTAEVSAHEGKRQIRIQIVDWIATGSSHALSGAFEFRHAADAGVAQDSLIVAGEASDFPAFATFSVPYELRTSFGTARGIKRMTGLIRSLPPTPADLLNIKDVAPLVWTHDNNAPTNVAELSSVRVDTLFSVCA